MGPKVYETGRVGVVRRQNMDLKGRKAWFLSQKIKIVNPILFVFEAVLVPRGGQLPNFYRFTGSLSAI
jgi:hypothetical protein